MSVSITVIKINVGMRTVNIKNQESAEKTSTKHK